MVKKEKSKSPEKKKIPLRVAGEKISDSVDSPSKRLFSEVKLQLEKEEVLENKKSNQTPPPPTTPHHPLPPPTKQQLQTSPKKDFTKVANSITRDALPQGLFKGTSKGTYDALYQKTRGAIKPSRFIKARQSDLLIWTGVSHNTLRNHLKYLEANGLIKIDYRLGDNQGAVYEVNLPEEIGHEKSTTPYHPLPPPTTYQNLGGPPTQHLVGGGGGILPENVGQNIAPNTSLKTLNNDDEEITVFADFVKEISEASKRLTGKGIEKNERSKWGEVAKLLVMELELAAARTDTVSSVPAFLGEVLRRKLETKATPKRRESGKLSKQMQVGKPPVSPEEETWEREPLSGEEKQKTLQVMKERKAEGHIELVKSMEQTYTTEDWKWLMRELEKE